MFPLNISDLNFGHCQVQLGFTEIRYSLVSLMLCIETAWYFWFSELENLFLLDIPRCDFIGWQDVLVGEGTCHQA